MKLIRRTFDISLTDEEMRIVLDSLAADIETRPKYKALVDMFDAMKAAYRGTAVAEEEGE